MDKHQILRAYFLGKHAAYGKATVRPGIYYLSSISPKEEGKRERLAKAYWNPTETKFLSEPYFIINLSTLFNSESESNSKEIATEYLVNAIIKINSVELVEKVWNNGPYKSYKVIWELVDFAEESSVVINTTPFESIPVTSEIFGTNENKDPLILKTTSTKKNVEEIRKLEEEELLQLLYDEFIDEQLVDEELCLLYDEELSSILSDEVNDDSEDLMLLTD